MAKRRFQNPKPEVVGNFWYVRIWHDVFVKGEPYQETSTSKTSSGLDAGP